MRGEKAGVHAKKGPAPEGPDLRQTQAFQLASSSRHRKQYANDNYTTSGLKMYEVKATQFRSRSKWAVRFSGEIDGTFFYLECRG